MRNKGQNHSSNKFLRLISIPIKALTKARDLYVRSITGCAAKTHYSSAVFVSSAALPRSRSSSSAVSWGSFSGEEDGADDYRELVRAASVRSFGHKNEIEMFLREKQRSRVAAAAAARGGLPKSSSVGMTRIDEEEDEGEGSFSHKVSDRILYPRSRSYAVSGKANF
ncbi:PREDICTED: uncharacterized protein LOC104816764 [Tarenaya hassleriana]|uniref:uncharacterized protein LOC104816764 n=1 Tax=Tarenaya hassleriana TaxID=28532 RepID=UPI00053C7F02|nr:PREDICTED: uncharacterized protein LOC104816764 [Tarenaya hassleriana]